MLKFCSENTSSLRVGRETPLCGRAGARGDGGSSLNILYPSNVFSEDVMSMHLN